MADDLRLALVQQLEQLPRITRTPQMKLKKEMRSEVEGAMTAEVTLTIFFEGLENNDAQARSRL